MKRISLWGFALVMVLGLCSASRRLSGQQTEASITSTVEKVTAKAAGCDVAVRPAMTLVLNQAARLAFRMNAGPITKTVQSHTAQVSTLIHSNPMTGHSADDGQLCRTDTAGARWLYSRERNSERFS
jgi:hypothetical protein